MAGPAVSGCDQTAPRPSGGSRRRAPDGLTPRCLGLLACGALSGFALAALALGQPTTGLAVLAVAGLAGLASLAVRPPRGWRIAAPGAPALLDPLTGLASHSGFRQRLEETLALARRQGWRTGVLVVNLRRFREVNEAHGRAGGDQALRLIAQRLRSAIRREDVLGRLAGDRFAVAQTALDDPASATLLAERLSAALAEPLPLEGEAAVVGADIGIAVAPADGEEAGALLTRAEDALALARSAPGPAIHCFAAEQQAAMRQRRRLERDLREAIAEGAFTLHWQPQRRLDDRRLLGFEALLRWPHPTRGLIPPDAFIPLAEATGLVVPLGAWVLEAAAAEAALWPETLKVAVNLSAVQVAAEGLATQVGAALHRAGLAPHRLELEVTESVLMQDAGHAARVLGELQALGVGVALDDFGTGWSSLAYLRRFRFDQIKMDRSFLSDLEVEQRTEAVVSAVLALGRGLGMGVVAEGIETEAQASRLAALGCQVGQGWLLGRPMPAEQVRALIARENAAQRAA